MYRSLIASVALAASGCGMFVPHCETQTEEHPLDAVAPLGLSGRDAVALVAGTTSVVVEDELGARADVTVEVQAVEGEATWSFSERAEPPPLTRAFADVAVFCGDAVSAPAQVRITSGELDLTFTGTVATGTLDPDRVDVHATFPTALLPEEVAWEDQLHPNTVATEGYARLAWLDGALAWVEVVVEGSFHTDGADPERPNGRQAVRLVAGEVVEASGLP